MTKPKTATAIGPSSNSGKSFIEMRAPYQALVETTGVADIFFHRWNVESVETKGRAPKGSEIKKTDDLESYVWRDEEGRICIPGFYLVGAIVNAAKYRSDPRSPRKSASDLFKAGVIALTHLAPLGTATTWEYEDRRRAPVQRNGITRVRPAFKAGWKTQFELQVILPEYIPPDVLNATLIDAGRLAGLGDHRPTYGRFQITHFEVRDLQ